MESVAVGILIIGGSILASLMGLVFVRRRVPVSFLETHHEVAGFFIGVLGVIYAVLLAFVVVVAWEQFEEARAVISREANQIGDLSRLSEAFPDATKQAIREALADYARSVALDEFPALAAREAAPLGWAGMTKVWSAYGDIRPETVVEQAVYQQSLERLVELSDSRRLRLHTSENRVPTVLWVLLWVGAAVTVSFTFFFGVESLRSQALMTAALAGLIAFVLFLIFSLSRPFEGAIRVDAEPILSELERIQSRIE
jgi:hypothetical protein